MILGLREKLKAISTNYHSRAKEDKTRDQVDSPPNRGNLNGRVISSQWGQHICRKSVYPMDHSYGAISFKGILNFDPSMVSKWARLEGHEESFDLHDLIFLDTETTGLSGGVGTLAFLVGLGYIEEQHFVIEQHIMRDFDEELSMLNEVARVMDSRKVLVSFNGKSYDYPLLENRMIFNRVSSYMDFRDKGLHIDLLHPSRRIWSSMLDSCSLTSLETNILQEYRMGDIPGQDIPGIYYQYLQDRGDTLMIKVMEHNVRDILAMLALFIRLCNINENPEIAGLKCDEWFGLAKSWEVQGDDEMAIYCYSECLELKGNQYIALEAKDRLAMLYKRRRQWQQAVALWESMADREGNVRIFPLIEIAKYYEHQEKNYEKALLYTDRAIKLLTHMGMARKSGYGIYNIKEIQHRRNRLIRKRKDDIRCL